MSGSRAALLSLLLLLGAAVPSDAGAAPPSQWEVLTRRALSDPSTPKFVSDMARARWAMAVVERELIRQNLRPNTSVGGRIIARGTTGDETTGACRHLSEIMAAAFKGAGIESHRIFTVIAEAEGIGADNPLWVNTNHAAVGVVVGNELVMFDPWEYAYRNGGWSGMAGSRWNGRSFPKWALDIEDYESFIWLSDDVGGNAEAQSAQSVQLEIINASREAAARAAKRKGTPPQAPGQNTTPAPPAGPAPSGAHWRLISGPTFTKERNSEPAAGWRMDFAASGGPGTINLEYHSGDQQSPMGDRLQNYATFTWSVSNALQYLVAGSKLTVNGTLSHRKDWSAGARVMAYTPRGLTIGYVVPDATATSGAVPVQGTWTVPAGGSHQPEMVIEFQCSNTGGIGRVKYFYGWGTGGALPRPQAPAGGADRWSGNWQSQWGPMAFKVDGTIVRGTFTHKGGRFEGHLSADGNSVMGKWTQEPTRQPPRDAGAFLFTLSADRRSFTGSYWYGMDSSTAAAGAWNAKR